MTTPRNKFPVYLKLNQMAPNTHDHQIIVKVLEKRIVLDKISSTGQTLRQQQALVADDTGTMFLNVNNKLCDKLNVGDVVHLSNVRVKLIHNCMHLAFDKWGSILHTFKTIPADIQTDPNFSKTVYAPLLTH